MTGRFLGYGRQSIHDDDVAAVVQVLRGEYLTQGPAVAAFEAALAEYVGAKYAVAVSSGTAALHVACLAAGMGPGWRGITSTLTFVATANACLYCGGDATAIDIESYGLNMSPQALKQALADASDVTVVLPVHYGGLACDAREIRKLSGTRLIIEDASHALGGRYADGKPVGSCAHADMTVFSFHPVKPITTGEGGAIVTNDLELHRRLKLFANHGIERAVDRFENQAIVRGDGGDVSRWYYEQQALGFNYRMSDIHAALGRAQLAKLDRFIARRREIAAFYDIAFAGIPEIGRPQSKPEDRERSAHHLYAVTVDFGSLGMTRARFLQRLRSEGVGAQVHYIPLHRQPYQVKRYKYDARSFPRADDYFEHCLSLPIHANLTDDEVERVVKVVTQTIERRDAA